jgi:hypothetical protein
MARKHEKAPTTARGVATVDFGNIDRSAPVAAHVEAINPNYYKPGPVKTYTKREIQEYVERKQAENRSEKAS